MKIIKRLLSEHEYKYVRGIYGDEIIASGSRSIWKCSKCNKVRLSKSLQELK